MDDEKAPISADPKPARPRVVCGKPQRALAGKAILGTTAGVAVALLIPALVLYGLQNDDTDDGTGLDPSGEPEPGPSENTQLVVDVMAFTGLGVLGVGMAVGLPVLLTAGCKTPGKPGPEPKRTAHHRLRPTLGPGLTLRF